MLITMKNGQQVDYSIFSVEQPYGEIISVESAFYKTHLSGNTPATMVIQLEGGTQFATPHFYAEDTTFCEFLITDQALSDCIADKLQQVGIQSVTAVGVVECDGDWSVFVEFVPCFPEEQEPFVYLQIESIYWTVEETGRLNLPL